jgi:hypothetical protein
MNIIQFCYPIFNNSVQNRNLSYYETYSIDHLADTNQYLFQESNDEKTDFGSIMRSVIFDDKKTNSICKLTLDANKKIHF